MALLSIAILPLHFGAEQPRREPQMERDLARFRLAAIPQLVLPPQAKRLGLPAPPPPGGDGRRDLLQLDDNTASFRYFRMDPSGLQGHCDLLLMPISWRFALNCG